MFKIKINTMLKDVIEILKDVSLRHKGVRTFKYQGEKFNNAQNNHATYQVYVDDISMHELNITQDIFKASFEIYILSQPNGTSGNTVLDVQNEAYTIACDIMAKIDNDPQYYGIVSIIDYSILTLARYTDDQSSGVKLSLSLRMPNPVSLCTLDDNFNDEPYAQDEDKEIDVSTKDIKQITINTIHLPKNRNC